MDYEQLSSNEQVIHWEKEIIGQASVECLI